MSQDKELEIQLQFLEEAKEYLDTIESVLLGLATAPIDSQKMDGILRAVHSVKGGAGMMGYGTLSHLTHRLEDSFKVLKAKKNAIAIENQLESLLLQGVDCLRQVLDINRQGNRVDSQWLETIANPVFDQLHEILGDPVADDATTMLGAEDGTNVTAMLFETEVEGCLARLEGVLADPEKPCLLEEVSIMAQELGGLGEMLQLEAFIQLCEDINHQLEAAPDQVEAIAQQALMVWRQSQALVLVGQLTHLPRCLEAKEFQENQGGATDPGVAEEAILVGELETDQPELVGQGDEAYQQDQQDQQDQQEQGEVNVFQWVDSNLHISSPSAFCSPSALSSPPSPEPIFLRENNQEDSSKDPHQENTVRIPVRQLDRLNDLFGELTIERNGLSLQLGRLRTLVDNLSRRVNILEASNHKLRTSYDQIATPKGMTGRQGDGETNKPEGLFLPSSVSFDASPASPAPPAPLAITVEGFDALEMDSYSDLHLLSREVMETIVQIEEVTSDLELTLDDTDSIAHELNKTAKQLQTNLTQVRMRPLSDLVGRFSRALRDLCVEHGKQVELKVVGKGTLIDRTILETLSDPLMHLLRNAFDHGIEDPSTRQAMGKPPKGTIEIKATQRGNQTQLTLRDDGKGINLTKIRARAEEMGLDQELLASASDQELLSLIFEPGFSTADQVTDLSGRGVGMDVVRNNLKQIRGDIRVDTQPGWGTTFTLTVPFTLSVARILLVESNGMLLAFPIDVIQEMLMLKSQQILTTLGNEVINWQGKMVSLIRLKKWLKFYCRRRVTTLEETPNINEPTILIINQAEQLIGLCVDRSWGEREVTVRQVEGTLGLPDGFSGCTILGNGRVVPLVDANAMVRWIISCQRTSNLESLSPQHYSTSKGFVEQQPPSMGIQPSTKDTILIIDDSINVRRMLALGLEKAGYIVEHAKDGQDGIEKLLRGLEVKAIICDIEMPRLDGYGFLTRVKGDLSLKTLPIIMLTSRSGSKHRKLAMTLGASGYFSKPYNERELLKTLNEIIVEDLLI